MVWDFLQDFSEEDRTVARECVNAACNGPFFEDRELSALFGLSREDLREILSQWLCQPTAGLLHTDPSAAEAAVIGAMNNLTGYPHGRDAEWNEFISAERANVFVLPDRLVGRSRPRP